MAMTSTHSDTHAPLLARAGAAISRWFDTYADARGRGPQLRRLNALSDAELARMGLTRDRIVAYVFRDAIV